MSTCTCTRMRRVQVCMKQDLDCGRDCNGLDFVMIDVFFQMVLVACGLKLIDCFFLLVVSGIVLME